MAFIYARYQERQKTHAYNEKLKPARNNHKMKTFTHMKM